VQQDFHWIVGESPHALATQIAHRKAWQTHKRHTELATAADNSQRIGPGMIDQRLCKACGAKVSLAASQQGGGGTELRQRRCFDLQAMALEQAGIDRYEQREIRKRTAVREEQFLHDGFTGASGIASADGLPDARAWPRFSEDRASGHRVVCTLMDLFVYRMMDILFYKIMVVCTQ